MLSWLDVFEFTSLWQNVSTPDLPDLYRHFLDALGHCPLMLLQHSIIKILSLNCEAIAAGITQEVDFKHYTPWKGVWTVNQWRRFFSQLFFPTGNSRQPSQAGSLIALEWHICRHWLALEFSQPDLRFRAWFLISKEKAIILLKRFSRAENWLGSVTDEFSASR